jgi:hypothetical protein
MAMFHNGLSTHFLQTRFLRTMAKLFFVAVFLISTAACSSRVIAQLPQSRDAVFVETFSSAEVSIKAKGIGEEVNDAENDARKCAVYFVLLGGTDPLLQTKEERDAFEKIQNDFFSLGNINTYVAYMGAEIISRVKIKDGVRIEKFIRVNKSKLSQDLATKGIIAARSDLREASGNPMIMVLPEVAKGDSPIEILQTDPNAKKAAEVIESYLTARKYDAEVPEQKQNLTDLTDAQAGLKGATTDLAYQLALSIGADVYITYTVQIETGRVGKKAAVGCRAYETTTARLLGTETGYSPERPSASTAALIEEAMNGAIDKTLSRIDAYWKQDLERGQQYKLIFKLKGDYKDAFAISDALEENLPKICSQVKPGSSGDKTFEFVVWQKDYENGTKFYRALAKALEATPTFRKTNSKLKRLSVNRKLLLLSIDNTGGE